MTQDHDKELGFLVDSRSGVERRSRQERRGKERRTADLPIPIERRRGLDRRDRPDRRVATDRRAPPIEQFSVNEGQLIEEMLLHPKGGVACPRCSGNLLLGPLETLAGVNMREVHCTGCRHSVVLVDLP